MFLCFLRKIWKLQATALQVFVLNASVPQILLSFVVAIDQCDYRQ